jgi:localization factor PodJL
MRPDLPWNVAGIPPEAREAARAAARREGLSVGEWLTRRILRSFADAGDEDDLTRDSSNANRIFRPQGEAPASRRDTDEMLDRVSRTETESTDVWRRIEEQLKGVSRRMETQERSQTDSNRAMGKAATEMNIAAREQSQAFDQLGTHVVGLADRLERVERESNGTVKDAMKALHSGLSRLADQIGQNANQSATQISSLVTNLESVAGKVGEVRQDAEDTAQSLELRMITLDDRIRAVEKSAQLSLAALEHAVESHHIRIRDDAETDRAATQNAIGKLQENISRVEARGTDPEIESRLGSVEENVSRVEARGTDPDIENRLSDLERSLASLIEKLEGNEPATAKTIEDTLKKLVNRVEATENRQRDTVSEFRAAINDATTRVATLESKPAAVAAPAPAPAYEFAAPPPPAFDPPPFPDVPTPGAPPPFQAQADPFAPAPVAGAFDGPPPFAEESPFEPASDFETEAFEAAPSQADTYLSAARRSARAAASAAEAETASRGFAWSSGTAEKEKTESESNSGRTRSVLIGFGVLVAIALIAGIVLSQGFFGRTEHSSTGVGALFAPKQQAAPAASQAATPLHALSPSADDNVAAPKPAVVAPLQTQTVAPAPVHTVPSATKPGATSPAQTQAAVPALDHLTALANSGNAKAELIVGLKYLGGDGVAVNEAQGAKWLERSAEAGEAVAQYRLGTLYEHGKGVATDPAKATHWYQAAAMQGNRKAMHNLAVAFAEGTGVKKDPAEAARWFSKAASMGLADSQFNLAVLYERGQGVPQSLLDAYKWYAIAASNGDAESKSRIEALATQISADDRAAAQHAADTFRAVPSDPHTNAAPQQSDLK